MDTAKILNELRSERDRITQAIAALEALSGSDRATANQKSAPVGQPARPKTRRRRMSAAGRKRIADAAKKMWAERKKKSAKPGPSAKQTTPKQVAAKRTSGGISPAGRKRISEMMKKRWAARRKAAATA
jgi:hypothetical protein